MNKAYSRIRWENEPSFATPLNETNLNKMDYSLDEIDNRVVAFDITKLDTAIGNTLLQSFVLDPKTGIITVTRLDGSSVVYDTALEKIAINFDFDPDTNELILYLEDGSIKKVSLSALIDIYKFDDTDTIVVNELGKYHYEFNIRKGSITDDYIEGQYLTNVRTKAQEAFDSAENSEAWAVGQRSGVDVPTTDDTYHNNSKYYADVTREAVDIVTPTLYVDFDSGEVEFTGSVWTFYIDYTDGNLCWEVVHA